MKRLLAAILLLVAPAASSRAQSDKVVPNPPRGEVRIVVISDINGRYGSTDYAPAIDSTVARIQRVWQPELVLAAGDLIAGQKRSLSDSTVRAMWSAFDEHVAAPLREAGIPLGFALGNHDASATFERDRRLAARYWRTEPHTPDLAYADSSHFPFAYSFVEDSVFVLAWDATSAELQYPRWTRRALRSEAAQSAAVRLVIGHLPLYAVGAGTRNRPGEVLAAPDSLRRLLERRDVHTYVSGHHAAYYPGQRGEIDLLSAGGLAGGTHALVGTESPSPRTVTVLDFDPGDRLARYTTINVETLEKVPYASLPDTLRSHNGHVLRRDLSTGRAGERRD